MDDHPINHWYIVWPMLLAFFASLSIIARYALRMKDNRGRISVRMCLALMTAIVIVCIYLKMTAMLPMPK
jgi:hypothetical protein